MSVGGIVTGIDKVKSEEGQPRLRIRTREMIHPGDPEVCVEVAVDEASKRIQLGDAFWWQGVWCHWTRRSDCDRACEEEVPRTFDLEKLSGSYTLSDQAAKKEGLSFYDPVYPLYREFVDFVERLRSHSLPDWVSFREFTATLLVALNLICQVSDAEVAEIVAWIKKDFDGDEPAGYTRIRELKEKAEEFHKS